MARPRRRRGAGAKAGVRQKRRVIAYVRLDGATRSEMLAAFTGNEALRGGKGTVVLTRKDLFGLMRLKGIGMGLYRWYAEVAQSSADTPVAAIALNIGR